MKLQLLNNGTCLFHDKGPCFVHVGNPYVYILYRYTERMCVCASYNLNHKKLSLIRTWDGDLSLRQKHPLNRPIWKYTNTNTHTPEMIIGRPSCIHNRFEFARPCTYILHTAPKNWPMSIDHCYSATKLKQTKHDHSSESNCFFHKNNISFGDNRLTPVFILWTRSLPL